MNTRPSTGINAGSISLTDEDAVRQVLVNSVLGLWTVVNDLTRLKPTRQVGHLQDTPLVIVGRMWPGLVEWTRASMLSLDPPLASAKDLAIPQCVANADEAVAIIRQHRDGWLAGSR